MRINSVILKNQREIHIVEQLKQGKTTLEIYGFDKLIERLMACLIILKEQVFGMETEGFLLDDFK